MKRVGAVGVLAAVVSVTLAGCGSGGDDSASGSSDNGSSVTIDHAYGSTEIVGEPKKIVTLGLSDQDPLLALGVAPIAVSPWYGDYEYATWPWAQDELGDATPVVLNGGVRSEEQPPLEEIASLEPDLILSLYNGTTEAQYDQLSEIAPTVVPTAEFADFNITWQEATRVTGVAIGREQEALDLIAEVEQGFADDAAANPQFEGKNIVVAERFEPGESVVRAGNDVRAKFFAQLGFTLPTDIAGTEPDEYGEILVSDEFLPELSRDLLIWNVGFAPEERQTVESNPLHATLPVVQSGKVLWIEDPVVSGAFSWGTVLSLDYAREQLVPQIAPLVA